MRTQGFFTAELIFVGADLNGSFRSAILWSIAVEPSGRSPPDNRGILHLICECKALHLHRRDEL